MNLIDESFQTKKTNSSKKIARIILSIIVFLIIAIIGIFITIMYIQDRTLKLYLNGNTNEKVKEMMVIEEDGTIYFPIKDIAGYFGYESYNGEYADKSEDASKCYIECEDEIANFALNSNKIYKLTISDNNANYNYSYSSKPVKAMNGKLYATSDAIENAFNVSFSYNADKKRAYMYTMPYLIELYETQVLDYGYESISEDFTNQKTILNNMIIVSKKQNKTYGVIDANGNVIIEAKYDDIKYLPNSGDFLVKSNNKVGIISAKRETKIQILYDSLELIDASFGLYLAKKDDKYGIIDSKGNIKLYIEYDQIGIDASQFEQNNIKNRYLLDNGLIPVKKDKYWGAFDKNGKQIVDFVYDSFGYVASNNKDAINLLLIPDYNVLVACQNKKYALINSAGEQIVIPVLDDVYMTISSGKKYYYMNVNDQTINVEEYLDSIGVKPKDFQTNKNNNTNTIEQENTITEENKIIQNNVVQNVVMQNNAKQSNSINN